MHTHTSSQLVQHCLSAIACAALPPLIFIFYLLLAVAFVWRCMLADVFCVYVFLDCVHTHCLQAPVSKGICAT